MSRAHDNRVVAHLERARQEGVRAVLGGAPGDGDGYFVPPTMLVDVPEGC